MGKHGKHRSLVKIWAAAALLCGSTAAADCRQALALGLDVSGSVDANEYAMQRNGVAHALSSDAVRAVLLRQPEAPVYLTVFEWSGPEHQVIVQPWIAISAETLPLIADTLRNSPRINGSPTTAIGPAMSYGAALLAQLPDCWKQTLDISGDGKANTGPRPQDLALGINGQRVTINGLVIGAGDHLNRDEQQTEIKELSSYYEAYVIRGPGAFVETALGFESYAAAMERKLLRELQSIALSALPVIQ